MLFLYLFHNYIKVSLAESPGIRHKVLSFPRNNYHPSARKTICVGYIDFVLMHTVKVEYHGNLEGG